MATPHREPPLASFQTVVGALRAIAEPTRLRLCVLLLRDELTVTEIGHVLAQSQPRISRHLRLLVDAGILERSPEGAYVFYRVTDDTDVAEVVRRLAALCPDDDPVVAADAVALDEVRAMRLEAAAAYLSTRAKDWDTLRALYIPETEIERDMLELLEAGDPVERLVDIGTGTGRILELMAPRAASCVGLDISRDMLALARANLSKAQLPSAWVRQGDLHRPPLDAASFDVATMHHVLRHVEDPGGALADAAKLVRTNGRLLVVDFAPHALEHLRETHGHRHLGISDAEMASWARDAGLAIEADRTLAPDDGDDRLTVRLWLLRVLEPAALEELAVA